MGGFSKFSILRAMLFGLSFCGLVFSGCKELESLHADANLKLDPKISPSIRQLLESDALAISTYQFNGTPDSLYAQVFGSNSPSALLTFLNNRIHYIIPYEKSFGERLRVPYFPWLDASSGKITTAAESRSIIMAVNMGPGIWMQGLASGTKFMVQIGEHQIPVKSPRVGIMTLGPGYDRTMGKVELTPAYRSSVLIHEARHSDCETGLSQQDMTNLRAGLPTKSNACGHRHVKCPAGHPLEGLIACDDQPWGAYAVQMIYANTIAKSCANCDPRSKNQSLMMMLDAKSRVLVLKDMLAGRLGKPNMGQADLARNQDPGVQSFIKSLFSARNGTNTLGGGQ